MANKDLRFEKTSKILNIITNFAQIILALFTICAFFTTVIPIYQNAVLNESIAKKELALSNLTIQYDSLKTEYEKSFTAISMLKIEKEGLLSSILKNEKLITEQINKNRELNASMQALKNSEAQLSGSNIFQNIMIAIASHDLERMTNQEKKLIECTSRDEIDIYLNDYFNVFYNIILKNKTECDNMKYLSKKKTQEIFDFIIREYNSLKLKYYNKSEIDKIWQILSKYIDDKKTIESTKSKLKREDFSDFTEYLLKSEREILSKFREPRKTTLNL